MKKRKKLAKKILLKLLLCVVVASGLGAKGTYAGRSESVGQKSSGTTLIEEIQNPRKLRHVGQKPLQPKTQNTDLFNPNDPSIQAFLSRSSVVLANDDTQSENTDSEWEDDTPLPPKQSQVGHQDATSRSLTISQDIKKTEPVSKSKITKASQPLKPIQGQNNLSASGGKSPLEELEEAIANRRKVFEDDDIDEDDTLVNPKPNPMPEDDAKYEPQKSVFATGKLDSTHLLPLHKLESAFASRPEKSSNLALFSDIAGASEVAFLARQAIPSLQQKRGELNQQHLESFKSHTEALEAILDEEGDENLISLRRKIGNVRRSAQSLGLQLENGIQTINNIPIADFAEQYKQLLSEDIVLDPSGHRLGSELARDFLYNLKTEAGKGAKSGFDFWMRTIMHQDDRLAYALELHGISLPYFSDDLTAEKIREYAYLKEKSISNDNKKKLQAIKNLRDKIYEDAKAAGDISEVPEEIWKMYSNLSVETRAGLVGEYGKLFVGWDADLLLTKSQMDKVKIKKQEEESAREASKRQEEDLRNEQIAMSRGIEYPTEDVRIGFDKVSVSSIEFEKLKNDGLLTQQPNPYYGVSFPEKWQMADQEYVWEDHQPKGDLTLEQIGIIRKGMKAEREELSYYVKRLEQEEAYHSDMQNNINASQAPFEEKGHEAKYALLHGLAEKLTQSQNDINRIKEQVQEIESPKSLQYYLDTYSPKEPSVAHAARSDRAEKLIKKVVPESMQHVFEEEKKQEPSGILQIDGSDASTNHVTDNLDYLDLANHKSDKKSEVRVLEYEDAIGKNSIEVKQDFAEAIEVIKDNINSIKDFSYVQIREAGYDNKMSMFQSLIKNTEEELSDIHDAFQTLGIDSNDQVVQSLTKVLSEQDAQEEEKQETYRKKVDEIFAEKQKEELKDLENAKLVSEAHKDVEVETNNDSEGLGVEIPKLEDSAKKFDVTLKKVRDEDKQYHDAPKLTSPLLDQLQAKIAEMAARRKEVESRTTPITPPISQSTTSGGEYLKVTGDKNPGQSLVFNNDRVNEKPTKSDNDSPVKLEPVEKMVFERSVAMHLDQVASRIDFSRPVTVDMPPAGSSSSFAPANMSGVNYLSPKASAVTTDVAQKFGSVKASEESSATKPSELPGDKSVGVIENNINTKQKPNKSPSGVSSGSEEVDLPMPQAGIWAKLSGGKAHQEKDGAISAFDMSQIAITGGFDLSFAENVVFGIAGTRNEISLVSEDQKFADMNANVFSGYASFRLKSNLILGVQAGKGWFSSKSDASLKLENSFASANVKYGISLGHGVILAPKLGLDFMQIKDGDKVDDRNFSGSASLSLSKRFKISDEIALTPEIHGGFAGVLNGKERALNISKALSNTPDKGTKHMFGFSAKLEGTNRAELEAGYDYTGWKKFGSHQGYLQVKLKF